MNEKGYFEKKYQGAKMRELEERDKRMDTGGETESADEESQEVTQDDVDRYTVETTDAAQRNEQAASAKEERGLGWLKQMKQNLAALDEKGAKSTLADGEELPDHLK